MKRELRVDPEEVTDVVQEARRLDTFGDSVAERALSSARKEDLLDRMAMGPRSSGEGGPG